MSQPQSFGVVTSGRSGPRWDAQRIVKKIRTLHRQRKPLWSRRVRQSHASLHAAAIHWFGSYRNAIQAAGVDYTSIQNMQLGRWNKQAVCREIRRLHREKAPLHHAAVERTHADMVLAAYRYFGSYEAAISAAGLNYNRIRIRPMPTWDKELVLSRLKTLQTKNTGLWKRAIRRSEPYLEQAARRCFGSFERAARLGGISKQQLQPPPYRFWSPAKIVGELHALHAKNPKLLKPTALLEKYPRLIRACQRRFGSYRLALEAAGYSYRDFAGRPVMSGQQVIEKLTDLFERGRDLRYSRVRLQHRKLLEAAKRCFGSYEKAINAAGLEYPPIAPVRHWTAPLVLKTLKELNRNHSDLRIRQFRKARLPLFEAIRHFYGTYQQALKVAGIDYTEMVAQQLARQLPARKTRSQ